MKEALPTKEGGGDRRGGYWVYLYSRCIGVVDMGKFPSLDKRGEACFSLYTEMATTPKRFKESSIERYRLKSD